MDKNENFGKENHGDWQRIHHAIFGDIIPNHCEWTNLADIISVLNIIGNVEASNHLFFPSGGGADLEGAKKSRERGCLELITGIAEIVKPKILIFEKIGDNFEWNYFRLEAQDLKTSGVYSKYSPDFCFEEVLEVRPLEYVNRSFWDEGRYEDQPLPKEARPISRYFRGSFVIFKKTSVYNSLNGELDGYDAKHDKINASAFREFVMMLSEKINDKSLV